MCVFLSLSSSTNYHGCSRLWYSLPWASSAGESSCQHASALRRGRRCAAASGRAQRHRRARAVVGGCAAAQESARGSWCFFMSIDVSALYVSHGCTYVHDAYERTTNNQTATITNWNPAVAMCRADQVLSLKQNHLHSVSSSFMIFRGWMP